MATVTGTLLNQVTPMAGGVNSSSGLNETYLLSVGGTWAVGDEFSLVFTDSTTGVQTTIGAGNVTGIAGTFCYTYDKKVYVLSAATVYFSAINLPTTFNDSNASGDGFVTMSNSFGSTLVLNAMAVYQGRLAFFSRNTVQIWNIDANPLNWSLSQVLDNIGTFAPESVKPIGDLDVYFLSDTGFRSLRVRDSSNNAFVNDAGSPIDTVIQASLNDGTPTTNAAACGTVDPSANRYWCYLNGVIYVLSSFPSNKIQAWSTYQPTDTTGDTFTPSRFVILNGQVFARGKDSGGNDAIYAYGGSDNNTYDSTVATVQTNFYDGKSPKIKKTVQSLEAALNCAGGSATWSIGVACSDIAVPTTPQFQNVVTAATQATFDTGKKGVSGKGSHFALLAVSSGSGPAIFSSFALQFQKGAEQ